MNKTKNFKILWHYLKDEKLRIFLYVILVLLTYLPVMATAYFWGKALEYLVLKDLGAFTFYLVLWSLIYIITYTILQIPRDKLYNYLEIKFTKTVAKDLFNKTLNLPAKAFEDMGVGELINRLYTDPERVMDLIAKLIRLICRAFVVVIVFVVALKVSFVLALEILIFGFVMGYISYKFFPRIKETQEKIKKQSDEYVKVATEDITGIREIKSLGIKKNVFNIIDNKINILFYHSEKIRNYEVYYYSLNNLTYFVLQFIILFTCGILLIKGHISLSLFVMIETYIWRIDAVVESISDFGVNYNKVSVSLKRIDEIVNNKLYKDEKFGKKELVNPKGIIEFKDVTFKYPGDKQNVLNELNLQIKPNKKIAIIGRSGNGKTTVFNLLLRYFDTKQGKILIDDINIKDLTEESLRKNISIIRQDPFLFNLSIIDNFKLVKEDVTIEEIKGVCQKAYIDEYIESLPNKYETIIGEGGVNLSGGQKQRLAIARTLLLNTKIILFDEATSALDNESQEYIKKTIDDLVKTHTVVIVAHRLSTIMDADVIHLIDKGKLVASGTHEKLLTKNEIYQKLYTKELNNNEKEE